jgi:hypothetical protein
MGKCQQTYDVRVELAASTSVQEFSKVFEALAALQGTGDIRLRIDAVRANPPARVLRLTLRNESGREKAIAIDIADDPGFVDRSALDATDLYFKRSLTPATPKSSGKIRAFGLNNPAINPATALRILKRRVATGRGLAELTRDARQLFALPTPRAFEVPPSVPAEPLVLFQTRLWSPDTTDQDREEINHERILLIQTLRRAFKERFIGGAIPTEFATKHYPGLITREPFSMRAYPRILRRPLVAIYSSGLRDSVGFKMSEYLAASRCIVGHHPTSELPESLIANRHYLPFEAAEDCAAQCDRLLCGNVDSAAMRMANHEYYRTQVEPAAHVRKILRSAFA